MSLSVYKVAKINETTLKVYSGRKNKFQLKFRKEGLVKSFL